MMGEKPNIPTYLEAMASQFTEKTEARTNAIRKAVALNKSSGPESIPSSLASV